MTAEDLAKILGGRKAGGMWMARCPAHDDRTPSLAIAEKDGKVLVYCHAGCSQSDVIGALRARGAWNDLDLSAHRQFLRKPGRQPPAEPLDDTLNRIRAALAIWRASHPADGTPVEAYLAARGITLPVPPSLRFHPALRHPAGGCWPAMVALVVNGKTGEPVAIHRTFLARDGSGKAAVDRPKLMLGPCRGGVVRLAEPGDVLMIGEGIETCLSAMQATGHAAWAALSAPGLLALELPAEVRNIIVLADADDAGAGEAAARDCAARWKPEGRRVRIARPPQGMDFNDMLRRAPRVGEAAR